MPNIQSASSNASSGNVRNIVQAESLSASQIRDSGKIFLVVKQVNGSAETLSSWASGSGKKTSSGSFSEVKASVLSRPTAFHRGTKMQRLQESNTSGRQEKSPVRDKKLYRESRAAEITPPERDRGGKTRLAQYFEQHVESCTDWQKCEMSSRRAAKDLLSAPSEPKKQKMQETGSEKELGQIVAGGVRGLIYQHPSDDAFVVKRLKRRTTLSNDEQQNFPKIIHDDEKHFIIPFDRRLQDAKNEAGLFQKYYGAGSAEVQTDKVDVYIKMLKIPGRPLSEVRQFRSGAIERYADMLDLLNTAGIMHGDLHGANVLYYAEGNCFFPIDFSNIKSHYFRADNARKNSFNVMGEILWLANIKRIMSRTRAEPQDS